LRSNRSKPRSQRRDSRNSSSRIAGRRRWKRLISIYSSNPDPNRRHRRPENAEKKKKKAAIRYGDRNSSHQSTGRSIGRISTWRRIVFS